MHDIARGDNGAEWPILFACLPAFALLDGVVWLRLSRRLQIYWLAGAGLLMALFDLAAGKRRAASQVPHRLSRWARDF